MKNCTRQAFNELISVNPDLWQLALFSCEELFVKLYDRIPKVLLFILKPILCNVLRSPEHWDLAPECTSCDE
jgi:phosphoenolpyruvate carboxykinase (GTP)